MIELFKEIVNKARLDNPMPNNGNKLVEVAFYARTVPSSQCQEPESTPLSLRPRVDSRPLTL